jgi:hypothetical protein
LAIALCGTEMAKAAIAIATAAQYVRITFAILQS